jgi:hypothetical protein
MLESFQMFLEDYVDCQKKEIMHINPISSD